LEKGYLPTNRKRRQETLAKRRAEYVAYLQQYYDSERTEAENNILHQVFMLLFLAYLALALCR
jgi:hypothetical protein